MQKARRGGGERVHRGWCGREREGEVGNGKFVCPGLVSWAALGPGLRSSRAVSRVSSGPETLDLRP